MHFTALLPAGCGLSRLLSSHARGLFIALALFWQLALPPSSPAGGFEWRLPFNRVDILSDHRNNVFYLGEPIFFDLRDQFGYANVAKTYSIRDYLGNLIESGPVVGPYVAPAATLPGWYKLYLHGSPVYLRQPGDAAAEPEWGDCVGGSMFVIFRPDPNFPTMPPQGTTAGTEGLSDNVLRGIVGSGPQRHRFLANGSWQTHASARAQDVAQEKTYYQPFDPYRNRALLGVFSDGTSNPNGTASLNYVQQVVQLFQNDLTVWEARNEPNYANNGLDGFPQTFALHEFIPFSDTIKAINPSLRVIGPGNVTIGPGSHGLGFIQGFLSTLTTQNALHKLDGISFHVYNNFLGDPFLARKSMNGLVALLTQYGQQNKERWQTEQGFAAAINGSYQPRMQTRWTMLMLLVLEQYGVPKEHNYLFYDKNGGFFDVPVWWINMDTTLNPLGCLLRIWSEELYGTRFASAYDFGTTGNKLYLGSHYSGPGKQVAAFMSAGSTDGEVRLQVSTPTVQVVSAFGIERTLTAAGGQVRLPVTELPTYVRFTGTLAVVPQNWGPNLALGKPVTSTVMGPHPSQSNVLNPPGKVTNGEFENWYYDHSTESKVWVDGSFQFPAWVEIDLQQPTTLDRVVLYSGVPWQWDGTLLDYDLQYDQGGQWVTLQSVLEPTSTFKSFSITNRTTVDSFFSDRWVFTHSFAPITTSKLRLWVRNVTYGGGATLEVQQAGGQTGLRLINLREVEAYASGTQDVPNVPPTAANDATSTDQDAVFIRALANDADADGWPQPLRLASAGPAAHGAVALVGDRIRYTPHAGFSGSDSFTYTVTDGLATTAATVTVNVIPSTPREGGLLNLKGEYFASSNFTNLAFTRLDPVIDFNWELTSPHPSIPSNGYSVRWTGRIIPPTTGLYEISTWSGPQVRLWLDGRLVIEEWVGHPPFTHRYKIFMEAGRTYGFKLDYAAAGYTAVIQLRWTPPTQTNSSLIPLSPEEIWRRGNFSPAQLTDLNVSGPMASPAGDGVPNLLKYALRLPPLTPASAANGLPEVSLLTEANRRYLALTYRRNAAARDLSYRIGVTDALDSGLWDSIAPPEEALGIVPGTGDQIIRRRVEVTNAPAKFIRLEVR